MTNIVIPMAGLGKRFADAGYKDPKPFIDVRGWPMIARVIANLSQGGMQYDTKFTFICNKEHKNRLENTIQHLTYHNPNIITVDEVTQGAACTVLLAKDIINTNDPLIIANSDQLVEDHGFSARSCRHYAENNADGGILCFLNDSPKWSYVRMTGNKITEVVEKQVVSNIATVGIYYYRHGRYFVESAENMIANNMRVNGEFYVAPTYNDMIVRGMKVIPFMVNNMVGLGTPEDLDVYLKTK